MVVRALLETYVYRSLEVKENLDLYLVIVELEANVKLPFGTQYIVTESFPTEPEPLAPR